MKHKMFAVLLLAVTAPMYAAKKSPQEKAAEQRRDAVARRIMEYVNNQGWGAHISASRPGCGYLCLSPGNHDALRIILLNASQEGAQRFYDEVLSGHEHDLRAMGFVQIDMVGMQPTSYGDMDGERHIVIPTTY